MQKVKEQSPVLQMCETSSLEGEGLTSATLGMSGDCETASTGASHSSVLRLTRSITRGAATQYCCLGTRAANSEGNGRRVWGAGPSLQEGGADSAGGGESDPCGDRLEPETQFGSV